VPDAVAEKRRIGVRGIIERRQARPTTDLDRLGAREREEGPDELVCLRAWHRRAREHASESSDARATGDVHEDGLRLVVGRVTGCDRWHKFLAGDEREELVPHLARRLLDTRTGAFRRFTNVAFARQATDIKGTTDLADVVSVDSGVEPQEVVEMSGNELIAKGLAKLTEQHERGKRIGPSGNSNEQLVDPSKEAIVTSEGFDTSERIEVGHAEQA